MCKYLLYITSISKDFQLLFLFLLAAYSKSSVSSAAGFMSEQAGPPGGVSYLRVSMAPVRGDSPIAARSFRQREKEVLQNELASAKHLMICPSPTGHGGVNKHCLLRS